MDIRGYKLLHEDNNLTLVIYLDPQLEEFANELGSSHSDQLNLQTQIKKLIKEKFPLLNITAAKVMLGSMVVTTIYFGANVKTAGAETTTVQVQPTSQYDVYKVQAGDTLSLIAKRFNTTVTDLKTLNKLTTDTLRIGQGLNLPFYTYTVVSGDTLFIIAKKFNTTVENIRSYNHLTSDVLNIGQKIRIPRTAAQNVAVTPTPTATTKEITYKVSAGDTLSLIAKKFATTVDEIKRRNNLTSDTIFLGQSLIIPQTQAVPSTQQPATSGANVTTYTVVAGDTLFVIAKRFNTTVDQIKAVNHLATDTIFVGQKLTIPKAAAAPADTTAPAAPTLNPIGKITLVNQAGLTISGTTEANSRVNITLSDGKNAPIAIQVKADATGKFTAKTDVSKLIDGTTTIIANASDSTGNRSPESRLIVTKDTIITQPVINNKNTVTTDNVKNYTLFGLTDPGAKVEISVSDGIHPFITTTAIANELGEFHLDVDLRSLNDGTLTITARSIDSAGNISPDRLTTITKQASLSPPLIKNTKTINNQTANGYTIFGTAYPNSRVDISVTDGTPNHNVSITTMTTGTGEFAVNVDLRSLNDTTLTISATQTSTSGIISQAGKASIAKDTAAPGAPILNNSNFINVENQSSFLLTGSGEPNAQLTIKAIDGAGKTVEESGQLNQLGEYRIPVDLSGLNDGDVHFEITQTDLAGNLSPLDITTLKKDTTVPTNISFDQPSIIFSGNINDYQISGTAEPSISLEMLVTDGLTSLSKTITTDANGRFTLPVDMSTLKDGTISVTVLAIDSAGNHNQLQPLILTKDTTAPQAAATNIAAYVNSQNQQQFTITGTSVEEGAQVTIVISDGTTKISKTTTIQNGKFNEAFDLSSLKEGRLSVDIMQTDKAGNTSAIQSSTIVKDTIANNPVVAKNGFNFENQRPIYTLIGTAEPYAVLHASIRNESGEDVVTTSATADAKGLYNLKLYLDETDTSGIMTVAVFQTDFAGNVSNVTSVNLYTHTVAAGETLYTIAKRFNTTVDALMALNHLSSDTIEPNQILRLPVMASEVINLGYMYFGKDYVSMVNQTESSVNSVSPSYFDINAGGTLKLTNSLDPSFISAMHLQGVRVIPFLSNHWNRDVGRAMLANKEQAAQQIADAVARYNLDGVNVDIENVTEADRQNYTEFVRLLRELIPPTKEVSVAVAANPGGWTTGWHGSYDYAGLAKYADYLMIMSYDESYPGGPAGPVASLPWVEKSIQYAINQNVSANKIVMGIAQYGRYWIQGASYGGYGISNWQVEDLIKKYNGTVVFDETSHTPKAIITINEADPKPIVGGTTLATGTYTIWYENEESIRQKLLLVSKYNLHGVGTWSIGQEDKAVWNTYATTLPATVEATTVPEPAPTPSQTTYKVVSGDTLYAIAKRYNTTVTAIKEANHLTLDTIYVGQTLIIPTT